MSFCGGGVSFASIHATLRAKWMNTCIVVAVLLASAGVHKATHTRTLTYWCRKVVFVSVCVSVLASAFIILCVRWIFLCESGHSRLHIHTYICLCVRVCSVFVGAWRIDIMKPVLLCMQVCIFWPTAYKHTLISINLCMYRCVCVCYVIFQPFCCPKFSSHNYASARNIFNKVTSIKIKSLIH